jgi:hypothetical protein
MYSFQVSNILGKRDTSDMKILGTICAAGIAISGAISGLDWTVTAQAAAAQGGTPQTSTPGSGTLSSEDRAAVVAQLMKTKQDFIESIRGLSDAQWRFKPSPFKWSIAQCADHIILSEDFLFGIEQRVMKAPAGSRPYPADQDKALVDRIGDRSRKAFNPDAIAPTGKYATPAEAIAEFTVHRDRTIEYARTTKDDLRAHFAPTLGSTVDAYQFLLFVSAHSGRHTVQIQEVKASPKYPASS